MKKTKAMSVFAAALLASSMVVSVSAADYVDDPGYILPDISGNKTGNTGATPVTSETAESGSSSSAAKETTVISESSVENAIADSKPIVASYKDAAVKSTAVAALAKAEDAVLTVVTKRYTVEIESSSVTEAKDVNLAMKFTKDSKKGALIIKTAQKDSFGCTVKMSVPAKVYEQAGVDLSKAAVYKIDSKTKKAVKVADIELDEDGNILFEITDGGNYVIL